MYWTPEKRLVAISRILNTTEKGFEDALLISAIRFFVDGSEQQIVDKEERLAHYAGYTSARALSFGIGGD